MSTNKPSNGSVVHKIVLNICKVLVSNFNRSLHKIFSPLCKAYQSIWDVTKLFERENRASFYPPSLKSSRGILQCLMAHSFCALGNMGCVCSSLVRFSLFRSPLKSWNPISNQTWVKDAIRFLHKLMRSKFTHQGQESSAVKLSGRNRFSLFVSPLKNWSPIGTDTGSKMQ